MFDPEPEGYAWLISCSIIRDRGSKKIAELTWARGKGIWSWIRRLLHYRSLAPSSDIGDLKKLLSSLGLGEIVSASNSCTTLSIVGRSSNTGFMHMQATCKTDSNCSLGTPCEHFGSNRSDCLLSATHWCACDHHNRKFT
jgi:hypothetical protein